RHLSSSPLFPYTTLFRSISFEGLAFGTQFRVRQHDDLRHRISAQRVDLAAFERLADAAIHAPSGEFLGAAIERIGGLAQRVAIRSEEHTSELQSLTNLVC